ncbi:MAG: hypothetical protein KGH60_03955 [Candidatus Micrarchaeota archaeon]|nr:hypothetical protein [Candidatus Micrarchaeota archaeon]
MSKNTIENGAKAGQLDMYEINAMVSGIGAGKTSGVAAFVGRLGKTEMTQMQLSFVIGDISAYYIKPKHIDELSERERKAAVDTNKAICEILKQMITSQNLSPSHTSEILKLGNASLNASIIKHNWVKLSKVQRRELERNANPEMLKAIRKNHADCSPL